MRNHSLVFDTAGSAAVEMALVLPILLTLMFGSFELGNYFLDNHIATKAVRDGARYASRIVPLQTSCADTKAEAEGSSDIIEDTKKVTIYGKTSTTSGDSPRLPGWVEDNITIEFDCSVAGSPTGIYAEMTDSSAPLVTVSTTVQYQSLFGEITGVRGFSTDGLTISAQSQVPVMGL